MIINDGGSFSNTLGSGPQGTTPNARVDYNTAMRVSSRALDYLKGSSTGAGPGGGGGGHFGVAAKSGALTGTSAGDCVFSFRWTNAYMVAAITKLSIGFATTTAFGTAQALTYGLYVARSFTAADSAGTDVTPATSMQMKRTAMLSSLVSKIWISNTGAITAGTRTLDSQPMKIAGGASTGVGTVMPLTDLLTQTGETYPVVLAANEGIVINSLIAMGATGVVSLFVNMEWAEIDPTVIV